MGEWTFVSLVGLAFLVWFVFVFLFTPRIDYHLTGPVAGEDQLLRMLQEACQARLHTGQRVEVLTNGTQFYPAMLSAIREAHHSINVEAYIFEPGQVADQIVAALADRARSGVEVRIVLDAIGSSGMLFSAAASTLSEAGCRLHYYQRLTWYRLHRANNRTHRELLIVDGRVAFVGGAGVADWWSDSAASGEPAWRDTMVRIEGPIVASLQGVFAENWLECCGEILTSEACWPPLTSAGPVDALLIRSSPADRATASRVGFQLLMAAARETIDISTPYFLPDYTLRRFLMETAARGVRIRVIVPGPRTDQRFVRLASRRLYGPLLEAGLRIHEYQPGMTHAKALMIDGRLAVIGTTNVDNRSFEHNDEVNVAFRDPEVVARLTHDFEADLAQSLEVTYERWQRRPLLEKALKPLTWLLERQQ
jgi:cardiolipin synthase A/B